MKEVSTLILGDCIEKMKAMPFQSVDLILTDPPYGVGLKYDVYNDTVENWEKLMCNFIPSAQKVSKMVIFPSCQIKRLPFFYTHFPPDWLICWYKGSTGCASYIGFNDWEALVVYGRTRNRLYMHDYMKIPNTEKMGNYGHPCPKPLAWAEWIIERATKENDIVLDPFCGSGTVGVACKKLGRRFVGIDISKDYLESAFNRINLMQRSVIDAEANKDNAIV